GTVPSTSRRAGLRPFGRPCRHKPFGKGYGRLAQPGPKNVARLPMSGRCVWTKSDRFHRYGCVWGGGQVRELFKKRVDASLSHLSFAQEGHEPFDRGIKTPRFGLIEIDHLIERVEDPSLVRGRGRFLQESTETFVHGHLEPRGGPEAIQLPRLPGDIDVGGLWGGEDYTTKLCELVMADDFGGEPFLVRVIRFEPGAQLADEILVRPGCELLGQLGECWTQFGFTLAGSEEGPLSFHRNPVKERKNLIVHREIAERELDIPGLKRHDDQGQEG